MQDWRKPIDPYLKLLMNLALPKCWFASGDQVEIELSSAVFFLLCHLKNTSSTFLLHYLLPDKKLVGKSMGAVREGEDVLGSWRHGVETMCCCFAFRFSEKATREWLQLFEGSGVPYGPINNMQQVFSDPQVGSH